MSKKIPTHEELMQLKELTRMTGQLSNVQIAQLKMWPRVILGANHAQVEFDPDQYVLIVDVSDLDYKSMMEGATDNPVVIYNRRMVRFNESVKYLLGEDYAVIIRLKGKMIGHFPPLCEPLAAHPPKPEEKK